MFTIEQIKSTHSKVKSGADFPNYIKDLALLGVSSYETFVSDGHTEYFGKDDYKITSGTKYQILPVAGRTNAIQFEQDLKAHQQGKTDYPAFCRDCASSGINKWIVNIVQMTCTYYDFAGNPMLQEPIPKS